MYILKIGSQYLTSTGSLSDRQSDALRIDAARASDVRVVKLRARTRATLDTPTVDPYADPVTDGSPF